MNKEIIDYDITVFTKSHHDLYKLEKLVMDVTGVLKVPVNTLPSEHVLEVLDYTPMTED
jgi:hypothetical protein